MAKFTVTQLEKKVEALNHWLMNHKDDHPEAAQIKQSRNYYVNKLTEMDEYDLPTIEI